jgi:hypothetical protein
MLYIAFSWFLCLLRPLVTRGQDTSSALAATHVGLLVGLRLVLFNSLFCNKLEFLLCAHDVYKGGVHDLIS